jgi:hypothetical protein
MSWFGAPACRRVPTTASNDRAGGHGFNSRCYDRAVFRLDNPATTGRDRGDAVVIAERTVGTHVSNLLAKLGMRTRSQLAASVENGVGPNGAT